ncbi:radical SAM protein [uncultured Aquimarina sp.]|uniref:radical SAM protein n=1 Tax=uncultured Aquimarina sp. TaxID=575652 RepID=UPI00260970BE|nr:radical SAM protein [uncultured Aquimarina sp.]
MQFDALILKVASRCNLNCSYCFMYNLGDTTYKGQPKFMSYDMIDSILEKTKKYILKYNKKEFSFIFHGGEPLLIEKDFYRTFITKANTVKEELQDVVFKYDIQTNGILIDEDWCALFRELQIYPSTSVDGTKKAHDMFRVDHKGNGSYDKVFNAVTLLKNQIGYADTVCVINIEEEPKAIYESFKKMQVNSVNFLIPDFTHDNFPFDTEKSEMADWLIALFDIWIQDPDRYKIPMFMGLMNRLLGVTENINNESAVLVIETNGEIEAIDSLKACGHGFTKSGMNVLSHDFSDIRNSPLGKLYFEDSSTKLCVKCLECPIRDVCQGGRLVHRFKKENGFNNPSVYCKDLIKFIAHIQNTLIDLFPELYSKEHIDSMKTDEIMRYVNDTHKKNHINISYTNELEFFGQN